MSFIFNRSGLIVVGVAVLLVLALSVPGISRADDSTPPADTPATDTLAPADSPTSSEQALTVPETTPTSAPTLTTDKQDYAPGEVATIFGSFFGAMQNVVLYITGQTGDGSTATSYSWGTTADAQGSFTTHYQLPDFFVPTYLLAANSQTGELLAQTSFTDSISFNAVTVGSQNPNPVLQGNSASYPITVNFNGSGSACSATFSITSGLPSGASLVGSPSVISSGPTTTTMTIQTSAGTPAGTSTITVRALGSGGCSSDRSTTATLVVASAIVKINPTLSVTNSPQTYTGSPIAATVTGSVAGTVSNVKYNGSATVPTNAGTYTITADFAPTDTAHFNSLTGASAGNFVISQASSATAISCPASVVYTGSAQTPCSATVTGANLSTGVSVVYGNNTNVGTATADASYAGDANHTGSAATQKTFEITKAPSTVTVDCSIGAPYTYTGLAQTPCTAKASGVGMSDIDVTSSIVYSNNVNAGLATADASWDGDTNHTGNTGSGSFTINPATLTVTPSPSSASVLQGAAMPAFSPSYEGFVNGETASVLTVVPTCLAAVANTNTPGDFAVDCSGGAADNYSFNYVAGSLHVFSLASVFKGLFTPLTISIKNFQKNSTIPIKFALNGGFGNFYGGDATLTICDETVPSCFDATSSGGSNTGKTFRYDTSAGQYIYNLSTKNPKFVANHIYDFTITINSIQQTAVQKAAIKLGK